MTGLVSGARHHDVPDRAFLRLVLGVFALVALLRYLPILTGKVPFPADIVNTMPPWESVAVSRGRGHHAELGDLVTMMYPMPGRSRANRLLFRRSPLSNAS